MTKSTAVCSPSKPAKPYPDFPLFPHATRRWAKKIRGKLVYFGPWDDPNAALNKFLEQRDDLFAGRKPRVGGPEGLTVRELLNRFLTAKRNLLDTKELARRTFDDYHFTSERISKAFGLTRVVEDLASDDFEKLRASIAKTRGPVSLGNEVQRVRSIFNYAFDSGLIDKPVRYGKGFKKPSRLVMRKHRQKTPPRMFEAKQIKALLKAASPPLRAMVYLAINCGYGNNDCATLPFSALDLDKGWVVYPRPKTAVERRCPLWRETVTALKAAIAKRPAPKDSKYDGLVFITKRRQSWAREKADSPVSKEFAKVLLEVGIDQPGLTFYALRHTFETIGGESLDQVATSFIMGHAPANDDMAAAYRERISDARLKNVVEHVRKWMNTRTRSLAK